MILKKCPGIENPREPVTTVKLKCPGCGEEIELFSDEVSAECPKCGFTVYSDLLSCVRWCRYARKCVGEEVYRKIMEREETGA